METLKFKTNIKCGGCIEKVTPKLDEAVGADNWQVDTDNPEKILSVSGSALDENKVRQAVNEAGFKAEKI
jgi:copper chaperone